MSQQENARLRARYSQAAGVYDLIAGAVIRGRGRSIGLLGLRPGERVLLVGAGTGLDLPHLPADVAVTAVDLTPAMLVRLRRRAARLQRRVAICEMDAGRLALAEGSFDAAVLHFVLGVVPDAGRCLAEAVRVLKPGGRMVVLDKCVAEGRRAPWLLRLLQPLAQRAGTNLVRPLAPLLRASGLEVEVEEPAGWGGYIRVFLLRRGASGATAGAG